MESAEISIDSQAEALRAEQSQKNIKCVVWDLDNTLWQGTLLEGGIDGLKPGVLETLRILDERGILQSVASKNEYSIAMEKLESLGVSDYFLYPQIHWGAKSGSLQRIASDLNIGLNTFAFVDDQAFEREEVAFEMPEVLCVETIDTDAGAFKPRFSTDDSRRRRLMYQADIERKSVEQHFEGPPDDFLASLGMQLSIHPAREEDLKRAEELTQRTHQLNTTGYTYSYDELNQFRTSDQHHLWIAGLEDKYGPYGKIGLALVERTDSAWTIKLLLMSCRVMSRGVGATFINFIRNQARQNEVRLFAEILPNERNRMMYMTYKFNQFKEFEQRGDLAILENDLSRIQDYPRYFQMDIEQT